MYFLPMTIAIAGLQPARCPTARAAGPIFGPHGSVYVESRKAELGLKNLSESIASQTAENGSPSAVGSFNNVFTVNLFSLQTVDVTDYRQFRMTT
jgi:hypothetical protein